jgi:integrase
MTSRVTRARKVTHKVGGQVFQLTAPGLKSIRRGPERQLYWVKDEHPDFEFYPTKTVRIHVDLSSIEACDFDLIESVCQREQQAMLAWADGAVSDKSRLAPKYNGTVGSLVDLYERDEESAFEDVKDNTKEGYRDWLKVIKDTIGARRLDRLSPKHFRKYHKLWRKAAEEGGEERVRRAYGCIQMIRAILSYGIEADLPDCERLRKGLSQMRFSKNSPREETMSFTQAEALVDECLKQGDVYMALTQALQYETFLRQGDILGSWREEPPTYELKLGEVRRGPKVWAGMTIDKIQLADNLVVRTSKTAQPVVHALDKCELVVRCVRHLGRGNPFAPVAARPNGKPWADRQAFSKAWRLYATAVGIPKSVWNMDTRASGITEAAAAGASDDDLASTAGHSKKTITRRVYKRKAREMSERVQEKRRLDRTNS